MIKTLKLLVAFGLVSTLFTGCWLFPQNGQQRRNPLQKYLAPKTTATPMTSPLPSPTMSPAPLLTPLPTVKPLLTPKPSLSPLPKAGGMVHSQVQKVKN